MKVLIVGGAGYVGSIIRPAIEREYECRYFDRRLVPGAEARTTIADVSDDDAVAAAMIGTDAVVYVALGKGATDDPATAGNDINAAFAVNAAAVYRFLVCGLERANPLRTFVYASSLSVYQHKNPHRHHVTEGDPPDAFRPYAMSKRMGEEICRAASQRFPQATILALRLVLPTSDADWPRQETGVHDSLLSGCATGPNDMRRLYLAALRCRKPGFHVMQCSGDVAGRQIPNTRATEILGWEPAGC